MTTSFTPGPWEEFKGIVSAENGSVVGIADCRNALVGSEWSGTDFATRSHRDANARLISAAPELLNLLSEAVELQRKHYGDGMLLHMEMATWAKSASAAIAKARGET
ncbi:hypothetical protein ABE485_02595 [Achromobacter spanius]|uniref:hypothetical protein n=1 Tax=Achromobacter spanius TaxID=217203 RepID=UPI00320B5AF7